MAAAGTKPASIFTDVRNDGMPEMRVSLRLQPLMDGQELLRTHLPMIEQIVDRVCRRSRLVGADAEDFASAVKLALIDDDYLLLRNAAQRSSLPAYLTVVIQRMAVDERIRSFGRWQTSAAARRFGAAGILAETLLLRDRRTIEEALPLVRAVDPSMTRERLETIAGTLPDRSRRPRTVELEAADAERMSEPQLADHGAIAADLERLADRAGKTIRDALDAMPLEDRTILRFHFGSSMSIADISRILRLPQRPLYRRIETILARLRGLLSAAGVDASAVVDLIGSATTELHFGLSDGKTGRAQQSSVEELS